MTPRFFIRYHIAVEDHDVPRLSPEWRMRIRHAIETKLVVHPDIFGKPLRRSLAGSRKLRVGDYRVIFTLSKREVFVWAIGHRRDMYRFLDKRF